MHSYNKITNVRGRVESSIVSRKERDRLVEKAEDELGNEWFSWTAQPEQFLNPYLIVRTPEKVEIRQDFFKRLFKFAPCYLVNTVEPVDVVHEKIKEVIKKTSD